MNPTERNGHAKSDREYVVIRLSDIDASPPEFPRVVVRGRQLFLEVQEGLEYRLPKNPTKAMGLLHHLAGKHWEDSSFLFYAIERIAQAREWEIHPF